MMGAQITLQGSGEDNLNRAPENPHRSREILRQRGAYFLAATRSIRSSAKSRGTGTENKWRDHKDRTRNIKNLEIAEKGCGKRPWAQTISPERSV